jgi:hypothetical protein
MEPEDPKMIFLAGTAVQRTATLNFNPERFESWL